MEKRFYTITQRRAAQPRSKRLRELGVGSVNVGGVNVTVGGGVGTVGGGDGHTHGNKTALDEIGVDDDRYIYLTKTVDVESNDSAVMASEKAKVGYADESGEAQIAAEAGHATAADRANYAGDSDKWDGNQFADYLDQPVRRTDVVSHAEVRSDSIRDLGETFVDGLLGSGMRMWRDENGVTYLTLDHLTVRQRMTVLELLIERIRSVGGQLIVSAANGKMASVGESGEDYEIGFEQKCEFLPGDLLRCQTFTGSSLKSYWVEVDRYILGNIYIKKSQFDEWGCRPEAGDEVVLMGSTTNEGRQSVVRISATEDGQPRMDVLNGISGKTLDGSLRARLGNLDGISDSRFPADGQPQGDGLYADNAYLRGTFLLKNRGQDVETLFSVMEGKIQSSVTAVRDDFLGDNSYLSNAAFADGLQGWKTENSTVFYLAGNKWIWANGNVLGKHGTGASVTEDMGRTVVRIKVGYIKQMNAAMRSKPTFATNASGEKEAVPVYLTFFYRCASTGVVGIGFNNVDKSGFADFDSLEVLRELTATEGYVQFSCEGLWNGTGDFTLSFGGEIYLYGLVLSTDKVEALKYGYRTLFEQSERLVKLSAAIYDKDENLLQETGLVVKPEGSGIYAQGADGKVALIGVSVEETDADGNSKTVIKLTADNINLEGLVTANGNFKILEDGSIEAKNGKFTGEIEATSGTVGGFAITASSLTATSGSNEMLLTSHLLRFTDTYNSLFIGADVMPSSMGGSISCPMRINVERESDSLMYGNIGMYISVTGSKSWDDTGAQYTGNHALYIPDGDICGLRLRTRRVSTSQTLSDLDSVILTVGSDDITLTLPQSPKEGQLYMIKQMAAGKYTLKPGSSSHYINDGRTNRKSEWTVGNGCWVTLVWDRVNSLWCAGYSSNN